MTIGESSVVRMVLSMLGPDLISEIDNYINDVSSRNFMIMNSMDEVNNIFGESSDKFLEGLSYDEAMDLKYYTGYNYRDVNAILRDNWNYEVNGFLTDSKRKELMQISRNIESCINKFELPKLDFVCFRGTVLSSFSGYGISTLSELINLKGRFLYEEGFTSTSILKESSYINKQLDDGRFCNVGIRYLIPSECEDGALLLSNNISYCVNQNEFLLNTGSLHKVLDVSLDEVNNTAILTVMLIPKKIYDINYKMDNSISK